MNLETLETLEKQIQKTDAQFFFVYAVDDYFESSEKRVTDKEHLLKAIEMAKQDFKGHIICLNKASFCFDGYLVQGDYIGSFKS